MFRPTVHLHCHTFRCHHARGADRDYPEAALAAGYRVLGFSDHCPWPFPDGYVSGIRMTPAEAPGYFESLRALRAEFEPKGLRILIGFEAEYIPELDAAQRELYATWPIDYLILGQHYLGMESHGVYCGTETKDESLLERYVALCIEALSTGRYHYLAHPDLLHFTGPEEAFTRHYRRLCDFLKERGLPVEVNMLGFGDGRHYPSERFLRIAAAAGCEAVIGVDSHRPEALLDTAIVDRAAELCERVGLPLVDAPLPSPRV